MRTASHVVFTAPPVNQLWREAEEDPALPTAVSAGSSTTFSMPSSVRAICAWIVMPPWPTSLAAVWTSTSGSPPAPSETRMRAVE